ncbi:MAG TPA: hypothetical protein PKH84_08170, partial [Thermomonas sp.]|uniref:hypothetical protein n=1 Tax=Thermomonas sp. TaxID=1971895 RepID=UPI002BBD8BDF
NAQTISVFEQVCENTRITVTIELAQTTAPALARTSPPHSSATRIGMPGLAVFAPVLEYHPNSPRIAAQLRPLSYAR